MTISEVMQSCNIKASHTIKEWLETYRQEENSDIAPNNSIALAKRKSSITPRPDDDQIKVLEHLLADAQLKIAALNTLIDVAEEQLKINIRKKPRAKQS